VAIFSYVSTFRSRPTTTAERKPHHMRRCTGPCHRLLHHDDYAAATDDQCLDCRAGRTPEHPGHDVTTTRRRPGRAYGF
jgi:hypothetical protein